MAFGGFGPGSSVPNSHNILSTTHSDSTAHGVATGDLIVGSGAGSWSALGLGLPGTYLCVSGGAPIWTSVPPGADFHNLLNATHTDTSTIHPVPSAGGLIVGSGAQWHQLIAGSAGQVLESDGAGNLLWATDDGITATLPVIDNALMRWDGAAGLLAQNSEVLVTDAGDMLVAGTVTASGNMFGLGQLQVDGIARLEGTVGVGGVLTASGDVAALANVTVGALLIHSLELVPGDWHALTSSELAIVTAAGSAKTVILPASAGAGQKYVVKDGAGDATAFTITVVASGGATIDGFASIPILTDYSAFGFIWNGTEWNIV